MLCHTRESGLFPNDTGDHRRVSFRQENGVTDLYFSGCSGEDSLEWTGEVRRLLEEWSG